MKVPTELLPCPFCGETPVLNHGATDDFDVVCRNRKCFGPRTSAFGFSEDAIAAWNRRAPSPELLELREAVKAQTEADVVAKLSAIIEDNMIGGTNDFPAISADGLLGDLLEWATTARSLQSHTGEEVSP